MKTKFKGYYRPTEEEFRNIWNDCLFVFDTNVLLKTYRYSQSTREVFLNILDKLRDRIWIPYQIGYEFHQRRPDVIKKQLDVYREVEGILERLKKDLSDKCHLHPQLDIEELLLLVVNINDLLNRREEQHPDLFGNDPFLDRLTDLFKGKVGEEYPADEVESLIKEANKRYERKIPPGYRDIKKEGLNKYGDFILWRQVMDKAESDEKPIIFVTDDGKEDWWRIVSDETTVGPRPELIEEIRKEAGVDFYMYNADRFIKYAQEYLDEELDEEAIEEMKALREEDEKPWEFDLGDYTLPKTTLSGETVDFSTGYIPKSHFDPSTGFVTLGSTGYLGYSKYGPCSICANQALLAGCSKCKKYICPDCRYTTFDSKASIFHHYCKDC